MTGIFFLQYYYQYAQRYVPALTKSRALPEGMDPMLWSFINMGIGNFIGLKVLAETTPAQSRWKKIRQTLRILLRSGLSKSRGGVNLTPVRPLLVVNLSLYAVGQYRQMIVENPFPIVYAVPPFLQNLFITSISPLPIIWLVSPSFRHA